MHSQGGLVLTFPVIKTPVWLWINFLHRVVVIVSLGWEREMLEESTERLLPLSSIPRLHVRVQTQPSPPSPRRPSPLQVATRKSGPGREEEAP